MRLFPIIQTLRSYRGDLFRGDLNAGLTVAIMLIPQGMAYAVLAGLPPVYGLYASLVPVAVYALMGTSRQLAVGPVALISLLVLSGVSMYAEPGSNEFIRLAILTALGVGLVQLLMGVMRMGFLVNFLSHPVLSGFTSAAAVIIAASQLRNLLGLELPRTTYLYETLFEAVRNIGTADLLTAVVGLTSITVIMLLKSWKKTFPSALMVVVAGVLLAWGFGLHTNGLSIVGDVPRGLPAFDAGFLSVADFQVLMPLILVIALVSYMESMAVAKAVGNRHGDKIDANQELVALGSANIAGSFFQAFPTTGGFSRTAVNDQSGARTPVASLITAIIIAATVLFLTPLFYYLPHAVLAAIIMTAVFSLFDLGEMKRLWKTDRRDFTMLISTFAATLMLGIEEGIAIGVVLSLGMVIYSSSRPHIAELGRLGNSATYRNVLRYQGAEVREDTLILRVDAPLYFANNAWFVDTILEKAEGRGKQLRYLILDASGIHAIDSTGMSGLSELINELKSRGIVLHMSGVIGPVRDRLTQSGLTTRIGASQFHFDVHQAMTKIHGSEEISVLNRHPAPHAYSALQTDVASEEYASSDPSSDQK